MIKRHGTTMAFLFPQRKYLPAVLGKNIHKTSTVNVFLSIIFQKTYFFPIAQLTKSVNRAIILPDKNLGGARLELTKSEMEIMDVLWGSEKPLSRADLLTRSEEKTWKDSSVHILLNGLLQKGAIQEAGLVKRSKTYGRIFSPTMTREEYFATTIFSHRHKPQIVGLFEALLRRDDITKEDLDAISAMIAQKNV
jgi:predicted transcriptional regulator